MKYFILQYLFPENFLMLHFKNIVEASRMSTLVLCLVYFFMIRLTHFNDTNLSG